MRTHQDHIETTRCSATVLFADIHGFIRMSEATDPIELVSLINEWFEMMERIVVYHQGTIDKFVGDCVMAVFGCPKHVPDASKKAIRAAIEMRRSLYYFNTKKKLPIPIDLHIGVNTGLVVSGLVGGLEKREFTVMGDAVNIAARLEDMSQEGQILVGEHTYKETNDEFDYKQAGVLKLEGTDRKITVYELEPVWNKFKR
jgi:class 3 adenylate cyclase